MSPKRARARGIERADSSAMYELPQPPRRVREPEFRVCRLSCKRAPRSSEARDTGRRVVMRRMPRSAPRRTVSRCFESLFVVPLHGEVRNGVPRLYGVREMSYAARLRHREDRKDRLRSLPRGEARSDRRNRWASRLRRLPRRTPARARSRTRHLSDVSRPGTPTSEQGTRNLHQLPRAARRRSYGGVQELSRGRSPHGAVRPCRMRKVPRPAQRHDGTRLVRVMSCERGKFEARRDLGLVFQLSQAARSVRSRAAPALRVVPYEGEASWPPRHQQAQRLQGLP